MNKRLVLFFAAIGQAFRLLILPASLPGASPAQRSENHWADGTVAVSLIPMFIEMQKIGAVSDLGQDARLDGVCGRVAIRMKIPVGEKIPHKTTIGIDPGKLYSGMAVQTPKATLWLGHLVLPFPEVKRP